MQSQDVVPKGKRGHEEPLPGYQQAAERSAAGGGSSQVCGRQTGSISTIKGACTATSMKASLLPSLLALDASCASQAAMHLQLKRRGREAGFT